MKKYVYVLLMAIGDYLFKKISPGDLNLISSEMAEIPRMVKVCTEVANALLETKQVCIRDVGIFSLVLPTDYNRIRTQIIKTCTSVENKLAAVRRTVRSPEAIRATAHITQIKGCCINCEQINRMNAEQGKKFSCQIQEKLGTVPESHFRFVLDQEGRILEKL